MHVVDDVADSMLTWQIVWGVTCVRRALGDTIVEFRIEEAHLIMGAYQITYALIGDHIE